MKKRICLLLALVMVLGLCGGALATESVTKITVLRPGDQEKVEAFLEPAIAAFMEANPDIEVEIIYEAWGGWIQTYPTMFENDTQPDVVFWWDNKQMDSSAADKLQPLNSIVDQEVFDKLPAGVWGLADVGKDEIYYLPSSVDGFMLLYNKDVFAAAGLDPETPPATWDELLAACEAITNNTDIPALGVPAKAGMDTLQEFFAQFITQKTGTDMLDTSNQPTFNNAEGLAAMEFIGKLMPHMIPASTDYTRGDLRPLLRDGQVGMLIDSAWAIPTFIDKYGENLDESPIGVAAPPIPEGAEKIDWAGTNGWVATREETAEASGKLISWLMSDEMLFEHHKAYGSIPLLPYELEQEFYSYQYWKTMYNVLNEYQLIGMIGKYHATPAAFYTELEPIEQLFIGGEIDAQSALDAMVEAIDSINARQE